MQDSYSKCCWCSQRTKARKNTNNGVLLSSRTPTRSEMIRYYGFSTFGVQIKWYDVTGEKQWQASF